MEKATESESKYVSVRCGTWWSLYILIHACKGSDKTELSG